MTRLVLVRKTLHDVRAMTLWIGLALFLTALLDVLIYPQYHAQLKDFQLPEAFRGFLGEAGEFSSGAGFLNAEFFSWVTLLLITLVIIGGSGTLAGEEGAGTLDLLLAQPVTRTRLLLEKTAGLVIAVTIAALSSLPGFLLGKAFADIDVSPGRLVLAVLSMLPLALLFLALTLWLSAALPTRGTAAAVASAVVVVAYFLNMLGASIEVMETPRKFSPFYWTDASRILLHGYHEWARHSSMIAPALVFLLLALHAFNRRDIATGAREFRLFARLRGRTGRGTAQPAEPGPAAVPPVLPSPPAR